MFARFTTFFTFHSRRTTVLYSVCRETTCVVKKTKWQRLLPRNVFLYGLAKLVRVILFPRQVGHFVSEWGRLTPSLIESFFLFLGINRSLGPVKRPNPQQSLSDADQWETLHLNVLRLFSARPLVRYRGLSPRAFSRIMRSKGFGLRRACTVQCYVQFFSPTLSLAFMENHL